MCVCACAVCGMCVHLRSHKGDSAEPVCGLIRHRHFPRRAWGQCLWVSLPVCAVFAPVRASLRAPTCTHTHTHTHTLTRIATSSSPPSLHRTPRRPRAAALLRNRGSVIGVSYHGMVHSERTVAGIPRGKAACSECTSRHPASSCCCLSFTRAPTNGL